jgi:hypothetical protein
MLVCAEGEEMVIKVFVASVFWVMALCFSATLCLAHSSSGIEPVGKRTASFLASPFVAAFDPAPLAYPPPVVMFPPQPPPGMCRWERNVLDDDGRIILDQFGIPLKEYAIGSCRYPPNY